MANMIGDTTVGIQPEWIFKGKPKIVLAKKELVRIGKDTVYPVVRLNKGMLVFIQ